MQSHHKMSEKSATPGSPFLIVGVLLATLQKEFMIAFIYLFFIIFILSLCMFCLHVCLYSTCVHCPEEGVGCPGPGVTGCELSWGKWGAGNPTSVFGRAASAPKC